MLHHMQLHPSHHSCYNDSIRYLHQIVSANSCHLLCPSCNYLIPTSFCWHKCGLDSWSPQTWVTTTVPIGVSRSTFRHIPLIIESEQGVKVVAFAHIPFILFSVLCLLLDNPIEFPRSATRYWSNINVKGDLNLSDENLKNLQACAIWPWMEGSWSKLD